MMKEDLIKSMVEQPGAESMAEESMDSGHLEALELPAKELMAAVKTGNSEAVAKAMKSAYDICKSYEMTGEM